MAHTCPKRDHHHGDARDSYNLSHSRESPVSDIQESQDDWIVAFELVHRATLRALESIWGARAVLLGGLYPLQ